MSKVQSLLTVALIATACGTPTQGGPTPQGPKPSDSLQVSDIPEKLTIIQRTSSQITSLAGKYRIKIGDITGQEVLTQILSHKGKTVVGLRAMRVGDSYDFVSGNKWLTLGLARLHNRLIGQDYAVFLVGSPQGVAQGQIQSILEQISRSKATFVRNGDEIDGAKMAEQFRRGISRSGDKIRTARDFILIVASNRTPGSRSLFVQFGDKQITIAEWLGSTP